MFITVKFGDDEKAIFNPACLNYNLLQAIKTKCQLQDEDMVDLSDETGRVKQLHRRPSDYATEYIDDRETLILLRVEHEPEQCRYKYTPLVTDLLKDQEFLARLNPDKPSRSSRRGSQQISSNGHRTPKSMLNKLPVNSPPTANMGRRGSRRHISVIDK